MIAGADFSDLTTRILSAIVMLVIGVWSIWAGGDVFAMVLIVVAGLMGWEVSRMHCVNHLVPMVYGLLISAALLCFMFQPLSWAIGAGVLVAGTAFFGHQKSPVTVLQVGVVVVLACAGLHEIRTQTTPGVAWTLWLILVVVATDVGGYFAGKLIGGPKVWPRISPKKTWAGIIGGWILAAIIGFCGVQFGLAGSLLIVVSVILSAFSQIGDMLESVIKRRAGVKDSSNLIPGHGGLMDRFDGLVGAALVIEVWQLMGIT